MYTPRQYWHYIGIQYMIAKRSWTLRDINTVKREHAGRA